jgi:hypothetical protein
MASLGIQIDNMLQFLPQDKVAAFTTMKPNELLTNTMRAVRAAATPRDRRATVTRVVTAATLTRVCCPATTAMRIASRVSPPPARPRVPASISVRFRSLRDRPPLSLSLPPSLSLSRARRPFPRRRRSTRS